MRNQFFGNPPFTTNPWAKISTLVYQQRVAYKWRGLTGSVYIPFSLLCPVFFCRGSPTGYALYVVLAPAYFLLTWAPKLCKRFRSVYLFTLSQYLRFESFRFPALLCGAKSKCTLHMKIKLNIIEPTNWIELSRNPQLPQNIIQPHRWEVSTPRDVLRCVCVFVCVGSHPQNKAPPPPIKDPLRRETISAT